jgi:hypothetical protein
LSAGPVHWRNRKKNEIRQSLRRGRVNFIRSP